MSRAGHGSTPLRRARALQRPRSLWWEAIQRRAECEPHAKAANEYAGLLHRPCPRQARVARASSEPCIRLDMRGFPLARMMYSLP